MRQMCMCENARCPFHVGAVCDLPAAAKIRWHGILTGMCQQCLDMAAQTNAGNLEILGPVTAAEYAPKGQQRLFEEPPVYTIIKNYDTWGSGTHEPHEGFRIVKPGGGILMNTYPTVEAARIEALKRFPGATIDVDLPRGHHARLLKKGAVTGNETFDRIWSDFHGKLSEDEEDDFEGVLSRHEGKKQIVVALGKLNYMMGVGGFGEWIAEGYAAWTGDMLVKKLPHHDHLYPLLSKIHDMLQEILDAYDNYGAKSFVDVERLLTHGISRNTLWDWFKAKKKDMFRFRGRVTEPYDLEYISGKWGHTRLDDEALTPDLVEKYEAELNETETELAALPPDGKASAKTRQHLQDMVAELDSLLEALHYRMDLQTAWKEFKKGGWHAHADKVLDTLTSRYETDFTLSGVVTEAADLFNATPDEVEVIEQKGEDIAEGGDPEAEILKYLDA
jgi:hypothetical protein